MLRKIKCKHIGKKIESTGSLKLDDGNDRKIEIMIKIKIMIEFLKLRLYTRCRTLTSLFFHLSKIIALSFLLFQKKRKYSAKRKSSRQEVLHLMRLTIDNFGITQFNSFQEILYRDVADF